jgi:Family of unknown function (DUF6494)
MNEEIFNSDLRKFLKIFGVGAQREIEKAIRGALDAGALTGTETIKARARLELEGMDVDFVVEEDIRLA